MRIPIQRHLVVTTAPTAVRMFPNEPRIPVESRTGNRRARAVLQHWNVQGHGAAHEERIGRVTIDRHPLRERVDTARAGIVRAVVGIRKSVPVPALPYGSSGAPGAREDLGVHQAPRGVQTVYLVGSPAVAHRHRSEYHFAQLLEVRVRFGELLDRRNVAREPPSLEMAVLTV